MCKTKKRLKRDKKNAQGRRESASALFIFPFTGQTGKTQLLFFRKKRRLNDKMDGYSAAGPDAIIQITKTFSEGGSVWILIK